MTKQIKIKLLPNGQIEAETIGIKGKKCADYIELVKKITNAQIISQTYTQEFYAAQQTEQEQIQNKNILD